MAIVVTFDLDQATDNNDRNRIRVAFQRLGWESVGGSAFRYPRIGDDHPSEDWFNHVIPALMYFRSLVLKREITVTRFSIDTNSSAGHSGAVGAAILDVDAIRYYPPSSTPEVLSEDRLKDWLKTCANETVR